MRNRRAKTLDSRFTFCLVKDPVFWKDSGASLPKSSETRFTPRHTGDASPAVPRRHEVPSISLVERGRAKGTPRSLPPLTLAEPHPVGRLEGSVPPRRNHRLRACKGMESQACLRWSWQLDTIEAEPGSGRGSQRVQAVVSPGVHAGARGRQGAGSSCPRQ